MDHKLAGILSDITKQCRCDHCADIDWERHSCFRQKPGKNGAQSDCQNQLEHCRCIHIRMTLMFLFIFHQKTVIFRHNRIEQIFLFDQFPAKRSANQTSRDQSKCCRRGTDRRCTFHIQILQNRAKRARSSVSAHHRDRTGTHTDQRINAKQMGCSDCKQIL